jgi:hypothetical protein
MVENSKGQCPLCHSKGVIRYSYFCFEDLRCCPACEAGQALAAKMVELTNLSAAKDPKTLTGQKAYG